jgi:phenylpropionate dioxygenase-like ring-hydroxylating dioxygenase large terminal subunit
VIDNAEQIRDSLAAGMTLPASWYSDPEILRHEQEAIFKRTWQYAGRSDQVAEPGDWFTTTAGTIPVVLTRDKSGSINAFVNVCRHRGHVVASGSGHRGTLQCPYHAWTYDLEGQLQRAKHTDDLVDFEPAENSLVPVRCETWQGFVFLSLEPAARPLQ